MRRLLIAVSLLAIGGILVGCTSDQSSSKGAKSNTPAPAAQKGGTTTGQSAPTPQPFPGRAGSAKEAGTR